MIWKRLGILLVLILSVGYISAEKAQYVVTARTLNVRTGPGKDYVVYGCFSRGDTILVKAIHGQWATVQDGYTTGYVSTRYIRYVRTLPEKRMLLLKNASPSINGINGTNMPRSSCGYGSSWLSSAIS